VRFDKETCFRFGFFPLYYGFDCVAALRNKLRRPGPANNRERLGSGHGFHAQFLQERF
jgi:hypothetical protein